MHCVFAFCLKPQINVLTVMTVCYTYIRKQIHLMMNRINVAIIRKYT